MAALAALSGCAPGERQAPGTTPAPNIVLVTIESLRPDHVGCYGADNPTTPSLDALAAAGMVYLDAHSVTSWTLPAHASLFTGLYPPAHQAVWATDKLSGAYTTLAERLSAAGYQSAGVVSGPYLRRLHNLHQGFEHYDESPTGAPESRGDVKITSRQMEIHSRAHHFVTNPQMDEAIGRFFDHVRDPERPFFLFAYYWDPHYDYIPPPPYDRSFLSRDAEPIDMTGYAVRGTVHAGISADQLEYCLSQYDGEILWTDVHLGRLFARLRAEGLWDNTAILVTADHGEEFFEHGQKGHYNNLYAESVHVPLVVKYPAGGPRGRDPRLASLVDVVPTVLELAGLETADPLHGRSLLDPEPDPRRPIFYQLLSNWTTHDGPDGEPVSRQAHWLGIRKGAHKLIYRPDRKTAELYDVRADPAERHDIARANKPRVGSLLSELEASYRSFKELATAYGEGEKADLAPEDLERLRSLGYLP